jgi:hypothetical protein
MEAREAIRRASLEGRDAMPTRMQRQLSTSV